MSQPDREQELGIMPELESLRRELPGSPESWKLQIIDHHTPEGRQLIEELVDSGQVTEFSSKSLGSGQRQLIKLARAWERVPHRRDQIVETVVGGLIQSTHDIPPEKIRAVIETGPITTDLATLASNTQVYRDNPSIIEENSRLIHDPITGKISLYLGPQEHRLLNSSRLLGLIPLEQIEVLRETRIVSIGASVAAAELDLLASLGAENITFYDGGILDPADIAKCPGGMGHYGNVGLPKALLLQAVLQGRNPYGNFLGVPGNVVFEGQRPNGPYETPIEVVLKGAGFVQEVIDSGGGKISTRVSTQQLAPNTPLLWIADTGSSPFAGIEIPGAGNWFNANLSEDEKARMIDSIGSPLGQLTSIYRMVTGNLPDDHRLQLLLTRMGMIPYFSQTAIATRESAAAAAKLALEQLGGRDMSGRNVQASEAPKTLIEEFPPENSQTLREICDQLFGIE